MTEADDRSRVLRAIKKCLSDSFEFFSDAMDALDEIGKGSVGAGMTSLVGGYAIKNPKEFYRTALIKLDSAQKAMNPLTRRVQDGRVNQSHFKSEDALLLIKDITEFDYDVLVRALAERKGRESAWYRMRELREKVKKAFDLVADS
ncbi:MAG: hypothetical protein RTU30_13210 [Candidatus Thorarchaeota archaeon]